MNISEVTLVFIERWMPNKTLFHPKPIIFSPGGGLCNKSEVILLTSCMSRYVQKIGYFAQTVSY